MDRHTAQIDQKPALPSSDLEQHYQQVQSIILARQHPITGLLPASTAITVHGNYTDAWVRDNVYSILAPWGLALAYRRTNEMPERTYLLEQSVVKLMRGLLNSMMKQSNKVERFKHTLNPADALHAKYNTHTGDVVVADDAWGHLQLDATSLFLLMLAQMTASDLRIVFTLDEVNFVQNLVHYISRAYLTPDFGLWERGAKSNAGNTEINASSVGMVKAALEALRGFNLFGKAGGQASVIHVVEDDIANARETLEALLPRESASKEIDAALLSIIGYPAYAIENKALVDRTRQDIVDKLQGQYGCKRFLRDGHQTVLEDHDRLYYEAGELQEFENIESEWPLFFTYFLLDHLMLGNTEKAEKYKKALEPLFIEREGQKLLPELYYVPPEAIEAERAAPHSQTRVANENLPLVWAQSLSILGALLQDGHLDPSDIDPLNRRESPGSLEPQSVLVALIAENTAVKTALQTQGINAQTQEDFAPIKVASASALARAFCEVGKNQALGLSGRPMRALDTLTTSQVYKLHGELVIFLPPFVHSRYSYFQLDNHFLVQQIRSELAYVSRHWKRDQLPMVSLLVTESMLYADGHELLIDLLHELQNGSCNEATTRVHDLAHLTDLTSMECIDYLHGFRIQTRELANTRSTAGLLKSQRALSNPITPGTLVLWRSTYSSEQLTELLMAEENIYAQIELISILSARMGLQAEIPSGNTLRSLAEDIYPLAAEWRLWGVMRRCAALLGWYDEHLEEELARLVLLGIRVAIGRSYSADVLIQRPLTNAEIMQRINAFGGDDPRVRLLLQELVLLLGKLAKIDPDVFKNTYTLQCWHLLLLLNGELALAMNLSEGDAFDALLELNPEDILQRLHQLLINTQQSITHLASMESLRVADHNQKFITPIFNTAFNPDIDNLQENGEEDWLAWRVQNGAVMRLTNEFCMRLWQDLSQCPGLVIGDRLNSQSLIDSKIVRADMTPAERNFTLLIEDKLNLIQASEYRQLVIEALQVISTIFMANPALTINNVIVIDIFIAYAVKIEWQDALNNSNGTGTAPSKADAWEHFFHMPPHDVANALVSAFKELVKENAEAETLPETQPG